MLRRLALGCLLVLGAASQAADDGSLMRQRTVMSAVQTGDPDNAVLRLQRRIESGDTTLAADEPTGYLKDLLNQLRVPISSQNLVFSKTSLQQIYIGPNQPRAVYFNDDIYVAYVVDGGLLEIAVADPSDGTQFYILPQSGKNAGRLIRQSDNCLRCHQGGRTEGVAGHIAQSVIVGGAGEPRGITTNKTVDHTTPLAERWGGWYVTGTHRPVVHLGNYLSTDLLPKKPTMPHSGVNLTDVSDRFDSSLYLADDSDVVAMLIREHQTRGHNLLSKMVGSSGASQEEVDHIIDEFAGYVLFIGEAELPGTIKGTTDFARQFQEIGPFDSKGRSLRQLDLQSRLLKYRCSYLVQSETFRRLPHPILARFWKAFRNRLSELPPEQADTIDAILRETVDGFAGRD